MWRQITLFTALRVVHKWFLKYISGCIISTRTITCASNGSWVTWHGTQVHTLKRVKLMRRIGQTAWVQRLSHSGSTGASQGPNPASQWALYCRLSPSWCSQSSVFGVSRVRAAVQFAPPLLYHGWRGNGVWNSFFFAAWTAFYCLFNSWILYF